MGKRKIANDPIYLSDSGDDDESSLPAHSTLIPHRSFSILGAGRNSYATSYVGVPSSPKRPRIAPVSYSHESHCDANSNVENLSEEDFMDPDHIRYLNETMVRRTKRRRTISVCLYTVIGKLASDKVRQPQDNPLLMWIPLCDEFLGEVIRHEGRGGFKDELCSCGAAAARFRCNDCVGHPALSCKECILGQHARSPYHSLQVCFSLRKTYIRSF